MGKNLRSGHVPYAAAFAATLIALLTLAGCGDDGDTDQAALERRDESAGAAMERIIGYIGDGQYRRAYDALYPPQRELFSYEQYEACREAQSSIDVTGVDITETYAEPLKPDGLDREVDSTAVTTAATLRIGGDEIIQTDTYHVIDHDGQWTFTASDVEEIASGSC